MSIGITVLATNMSAVLFEVTKCFRSWLVIMLLLLQLMPAVTLRADDTRTDKARLAFIEANLLSIFYHEFGHAVIDLMNVPIYGQEEDAADVVSVLLIDRFFSERSAQDIAYDSAFGYISDPDQREEVAWWDLHGPDEQRFYNHVCLFYGANPGPRTELAEDLGLPDERAQSCAEEFDQVSESWGDLFEEMAKDESVSGMLEFNSSLSNSTGDGKLIAELLTDEVEHINDQFNLPQNVQVNVEDCDEPNAYYDPMTVSISVCAEFVDHLRWLYDRSLSE